MKILVTGAHFTPAQAVIEQLQKISEAEIVYVGRQFTQEGDNTPSVESQVLPKLGVKFIPINAGRVRRILEFKTIISMLKIPIGFLQSFFILLREKPDIVLSFGGYVGASVVVPAWFLNIPIIVHEQTLVSGLANKISNIFADKIAVSFDTDYSYDKNKIIITGNPFRKQLLNPQHPPSINIKDFVALKNKLKMPLIYITGGNQGSHIINVAVKNILDKLTQQAVVIHQTGDSKFKDFENLSEVKKNLKYPERYFCAKWFNVDDVSLIFQQADLAISRAGANTLIELAYFGIPTIVVPLPFLYKNEQYVNAKYFKKIGLAHILDQDDLATGSKLFGLTQDLLNNLKDAKKNARNAQDFILPDADKRLAQETLTLLN